MDREILFRGKRKDNGEWITSRSIFTFCDDEGKIKEAYLPINGHIARYGYDHKRYLNIENISDASFCRIHTETLGRFTGLTDKNGKRIFEGDILKVLTHEPGVVVYHTGDGAYFVETSKTYIPMCDTESAEVIGNVHDNPELIGGK